MHLIPPRLLGLFGIGAALVESAFFTYGKTQSLGFLMTKSSDIYPSNLGSMGERETIHMRSFYSILRDVDWHLCDI
jgi:hypothetical protein